MAGQQQTAASIFDLNLRPGTMALVYLVMFATTIIANPASRAQTFTVLHAFTDQQDGASPGAGLIMDRGGRLYGTTDGGFISPTAGSAFKVTGSGSGWVLFPLYDFSSQHNGTGPGTLTFGPDGNLYGATTAGGPGGRCNEGAGCGSVFKLQPPPTACVAFLCSWTETLLYNFTGGSDGWSPGAVIFDAAGNLYGTTVFGGTGDCGGDGCGTVYQLTPSGGGWTKTVLYNFMASNDGQFPTSGLIFDAAGNLYGTAEGGNNNHGVLYELSPSNGSWTETTLHMFQGSDGSGPEGPLIADHAGNLYGVTGGGGSENEGAVFELAQPGAWTFELLYSFSNSLLGAQPNGALVFDNAGNLYGATGTGGAFDGGTIFKLTPSNGSWIKTDLHDFNGSDGVEPNGGLIFDANGDLYGTAALGGYTLGNCYIGCGTAWEFTP